MTLERLDVEGVRCIEHAALDFDPHWNLISGPNASGKTSVLEAIYLLGRARSFRTARVETLIRYDADRLVLSGRLRLGVRQVPIGVSVDSDGIHARFDGAPVAGIAELATAFPVQALDPEVHRLIEEGPQERRRYLDWGVFHVEPQFVGYWQRFQRALRQRNAALKARQPTGLIRLWDEQLISAGGRVTESRVDYLARLTPHVAAIAERLLGIQVDLALLRGWSGERSFAEALDLSWERDATRGITHVGPHRADLVVRAGGRAARDRVSRGQQKLLAASLLLGQLRCDAELGASTAALLVDDPAAELDRENLERLLREVLVLPVQRFVTALDPTNPGLGLLPAGRRFHVEHGVIHRLI